MSPTGIVYVGGTSAKEQISFPGGVNFITFEDDSTRVESVEMEDQNSAAHLIETMERVALAAGVKEVSLILKHDKQGEVSLDGNKAQGTGFESNPISSDIVTS